MNPTGAKVAILNFLTWIGTIFSFQVVTQVLQASVLVASLALSVCSLMWVRQQARSHKRREEREERERLEKLGK
jgi:hypothetical protein